MCIHYTINDANCKYVFLNNKNLIQLINYMLRQTKN